MAQKVDPRQPGMSRRDFLVRSAMVASAAAAASGAVNARAAYAAEAIDADDETAAHLAEVYGNAKYGHSPVLSPLTIQNHLAEPPVPGNTTLAEAGLQQVYQVDVLVVGGGFAGIYAARKAHQLGKNVLLVDKGIVGKSGLTPWAHTFAWFDPELGDDRQAVLDSAVRDSEYSARLEYLEQFLDNSKAVMEDAMEYGWLRAHDWSTTEDDGLTPPQKNQAHAETDRHLVLRQGLVNEGVPFIERVMITELLKEDGRIQGAVGFYAESDEPMVFEAKAVILCTGPGAVRPSGFPTGSASWDGDAMAYRAGASIAGKEYTDFHWTLADCPGDIYSMWWRSFEESQLFFPAHFPSDNNMITDVYAVDADGGFITPNRQETVDLLEGDKAAVEANAAAAAEAGVIEEGADPRSALGTTITPDYLWLNREVKECAIGMGLPNQEGVWPVDDKCYCGIPGLYAAGCALGTNMFGAHYVCMGGSSNSCCVQGWVSAEAACEYVDNAEPVALSEATVQAAVDFTLAPLQREKGFSPEWAEELLCNIKAPYWVAYMKSEETLNAALAQMVTLRDKVIKNLRARNPHELRYVHEMYSKALNIEAQLRAGLFRTESRGMHYRTDFPARDDANWMCWVTLRQDENGEMICEKQPMPEECCGDMTQPYTERYPRRQPGELEFLGISE